MHMFFFLTFKSINPSDILEFVSVMSVTQIHYSYCICSVYQNKIIDADDALNALIEHLCKTYYLLEAFVN